MKVVFRVDSSHSIGTGHVMRCMVLADALREKGYSVFFLCRDLPGNHIFALKDKNFCVITLPFNSQEQEALKVLPEHQQWLGTTIQKDCEVTLFQLSLLGNIDWLVIDHYALDNTWETACKAFAKKIMVIDDLADRQHICNLLLDQNYYSNPEKRYNTRLPHDCKTLIGPQFALLRSEFEEIRKKIFPYDGKVKRLMVSLGGCDPDNVTRKVLEGIAGSNCYDLEVDVVLGATSQHKVDIQKWCNQRKNYHFHSPSHNMAELIKNADLAIGAGGISTWERCCLGLPSLVVSIANNQDKLISEACSANAIDYLGNIHDLDVPTIARKLNELVNNPQKLQFMRQIGMSLVDGLGTKRVVNTILSL
ncbi:MAG: GCN5-related N-acetyltransferase [uncultured bacterium]|nr:MAG: GCN5-related N-acetyltransferase [uncultured bacterium]